MRYGSYDFPMGWKVVDDKNHSEVPMAAIARRHGATALQSLLKAREITVKGGFRLSVPNATNIRDALNEIKQAVISQTGAFFPDGDLTRYYQGVQVSDWSDGYKDRYGNMVDSEVTFLCPDPLLYSTTLTTDTWSTPVDTDTRGITLGGSVWVYPVYTITLAATGAFNITLSDGFRTWMMSGTAASTTYVVDCGQETVVDGMGADATGLFDGSFHVLYPGSNTLTFGNVSGTPAVSSVVTEWRERFWN